MTLNEGKEGGSKRERDEEEVRDGEVVNSGPYAIETVLTTCRYLT